MSHSFISLAAQSIGTPPGLIGTMLAAIQQMKFHIRTAYGDSDRSYNSNPCRPFQGACQGNGAAPAVWLLLSAYLIAHMRLQGHQVNITSALTTTLLTYVGLWFVDDGDIPTFASFPTEPFLQVAHRHQAAVTCWAHSLTVTGGALKPAKCFWYPLHWGHRKGKGYLKQSTQSNYDIYLPNDTSTPLTKLNPQDNQEVMGIIQNPLGTMDGQIGKLEKIIKRWLPLVSNDYLPSHLIYQGFWGTLWPSIRYALPALSLTEGQANRLMTPIYKLLLPKLHVNRCLPLAYRYGTHKYFGMCLPNLHHEQTIAKLDIIMMHLLTTTLTNQHLQQSMEQLQLEVGVGTHFLSLPFHPFGEYTTSCWLHSLWKDIDPLPISIISHNSTNLPLLRTNDQYIMDVVIQHCFLPPSELISVNRVRLHHKCYALSHITNGPGDRLRQLNVNLVTPSSASIIYPNVFPTPTDYSIWNKAISMIKYGNRIPPLGPWFHVESNHCTCLHDLSQDILYIQQQRTWTRFLPQRRRLTRSPTIYAKDEECSLPPNLSHRGVYSTSSSDSAIIYFEGSYVIHTPQPITPPTLHSIFSQWGGSWPWKHIQMDGDATWLVNAIVNNNAKLICDGSFQPRRSTSRGGAAWAIVCTVTNNKVIGYLPTTSSDANSYRAELFGIYAGLGYTLATTQLHQITQGSIQVYCDNELAVKQSQLTNVRLRQTTQQADVLRLIRHIHHTLPIKVSFHHIKDHQDDAIHFSQLTLEAKLNVLCDKLAKAGLHRDIKRDSPQYQSLPLEPLSIYIYR